MDSDTFKKIDESQVNETLNNTQRYNMQETYKAFTSYAGLSSLPSQLKSALAEMPKEKLNEMTNITSKDQIIQLALEYLGRIDSRLKDLAQKALDNPQIDKSDIQLATEKESQYSSTGKCVKEGDSRIKIEVTAKKDASGIIAVGQELVNAALFYEYFQHQNAQNEKQAQFARECAKKFIGYMMINHMAKDPYMNITDEQRATLLCQVSNQDFRNIPALEKDVQIFEMFMQSNPEEFIGKNLNEFSNEDFDRAMRNSMNNVANPAFTEAIQEREKDIADKGQTVCYLIDDNILAGVAAGLMVENCKNSPQADPIKRLMLGAMYGKEIEEITGKTKEEIANNSQALLYNITHEQLLELENEEENVRVLERVRTIQNNISNNS